MTKAEVIGLKHVRNQKRHEKFIQDQRNALDAWHPVLYKILGLDAFDRYQQVAFYHVLKELSEEQHSLTEEVVLCGSEAYEPGSYDHAFNARDRYFGVLHVYTIVSTWIERRDVERYEEVCDAVGCFLSILDY